jgi:hypothetical protein
MSDWILSTYLALATVWLTAPATAALEATRLMLRAARRDAE